MRITEINGLVQAEPCFDGSAAKLFSRTILQQIIHKPIVQLFPVYNLYNILVESMKVSFQLPTRVTGLTYQRPLLYTSFSQIETLNRIHWYPPWMYDSNSQAETYIIAIKIEILFELESFKFITHYIIQESLFHTKLWILIGSARMQNLPYRVEFQEQNLAHPIARKYHSIAEPTWKSGKILSIASAV